MYTSRAFLLALFCLLFSISASAQSAANSINIISVTVQPVMPGDISQWPNIPNGILLTARTNEPSAGKASRLVVRLKRGDVFLCGNTAETGISIAAFSSKTFSVKELLSSLSNCPKLSEGSYRICFQFFNEGNEAISSEACSEFSVAKANASVSISAPTNIAPADNRLFVAEEAKHPIRFEWAPVAPLPDQQVSYRLRIWPLKAGQSIEQAVAKNEPIISKTVTNATFTTLNEFLPLPCEAPCKYVWNVQALDAQGKPIGANNGNSPPWTFLIAEYIIRIKGITINCTTTPGVYSFNYLVENPNPGTAKLTNLVVTSSTPSGAAITTFTPPLNTNIASGATLTITGTISASASLSFICIGAQITDVVNTFWQASRDTCIPVPPCKCDFCDKVKFTINPTTNIVVNGNNTLTMTQPIAVTSTPTKLVKGVEAQLEYFEILPDFEGCLPCDPDPSTFGNLTMGTLSSVWASGGGTHNLEWLYVPPKNFATAQNAVMTFTIPPVTDCCVTVRWCIRYVVTFADCTSCSKLVCYEKKICPKGGPNPTLH
jgi:hypothetical protein